jgi:glycosyltransferase involved in cell wall biosynthesis
MSEGQEKSTPQPAERKLLRPALIVSEHTIYEYSIFLHHLLVGLADESIPVALVCPPGYDVDSVVSGAVEVIRYPALKLPLLWRQNKKRLIDRLEKFEPNVLHCLCESKAALTKQLSRQFGLSYILTVNSLQKQWGHLSVSSKRCAKIIVPAESVADNIAKTYPGFAERIERINIGVFTEQTVGCFREPGRLAGMVIANPSDNLAELENLFAALRHLAINGYEFILVITSNARAEGQLRKLLATFALSQMAVIVPKVQSRRCVLTAGDIFIQPHPDAVFNPLLLEAMSLGTVIAGCKGGVDDLIIEGQTAVVFDPDDELSIYNCLQRLLDAPDSAKQLASRARQYLRENHTVSKMTSDILRIYHDSSRSV